MVLVVVGFAVVVVVVVIGVVVDDVVRTFGPLFGIMLEKNYFDYGKNYLRFAVKSIPLEIIIAMAAISISLVMTDCVFVAFMKSTRALVD